MGIGPKWARLESLNRLYDMRLQDKTALITGGNSGIGLATARLFVAEGARVAITGRNKTTIDAAAKELGPWDAHFSSRRVGRQSTRGSVY